MKKKYLVLLFLSFGIALAQEDLVCPERFEKTAWNIALCLDNDMFAFDKGNSIKVSRKNQHVFITAHYNQDNLTPELLWKTKKHLLEDSGLVSSYTKKTDDVVHHYNCYTVHKKLVKEKEKTFVKSVSLTIITYKNRYYLLKTSRKANAYSAIALEFLKHVVNSLEFFGEDNLQPTLATNTTSATSTVSTAQNSSKPASNSALETAFLSGLHTAIKNTQKEDSIILNESVLRASIPDDGQMEVDDFKPEMDRWKRSITYSFSQLRKCGSTAIISSDFKKRTNDPNAPIQLYDGKLGISCDDEVRNYLVTCVEINEVLYLARIYIPRKKQ